MRSCFNKFWSDSLAIQTNKPVSTAALATAGSNRQQQIMFFCDFLCDTLFDHHLWTIFQSILHMDILYTLKNTVQNIHNLTFANTTAVYTRYLFHIWMTADSNPVVNLSWFICPNSPCLMTILGKHYAYINHNYI